MRQLLFLFVFSALYLNVNAQITVTSATFPAAGDTLWYLLSSNPSLINPATPPGGNQLWDFNNLETSQTLEVVYHPAAAGVNAASFPGAELLVVDPSGETYFNVTSNKYEALGHFGPDPLGYGVNMLFKSNPAVVERQSPLSFFDIFAQSSNFTTGLSANDFPASLFLGWPVVPDSIRFRINAQRLEVVDGWGECQIPGGSYPVLREKRTEYQSNSIDVKLSPLGWLDVSSIGGAALAAFGSYIGTDTTVSYIFYSNTEKEEIAIAVLNNEQNSVQSVQYKNNAPGTVNGLAGLPAGAGIQAYPNPAAGPVSFNCLNLQVDIYTLIISDISGKVVWKGEYPLGGNQAICLETGNFGDGTYVYSLLDSKGNIFAAKQLVILKP